MISIHCFPGLYRSGTRVGLGRSFRGDVLKLGLSDEDS